VKYRHLFGEALGLDDAEISLLAVLMLRGPQTPGELKQRADRMHPFADLGAVHETLERLIERGLVADTGRRPGQKETRYAQTLGEAEADVADTPAPVAGEPEREDRIARLERELSELRAELAELRALLPPGARNSSS
jgi:uncharacterized protein